MDALRRNDGPQVSASLDIRTALRKGTSDSDPSRHVQLRKPGDATFQEDPGMVLH